MNNTSSEQPLNRLEKERARKRAKRACESSVEKEMPIENVINAIGHLNQKLSVHTVLLLVSSERLIIGLLSLIVGLLSLKPNVHSILLLVSSERLIIELLSRKLNVCSVLLLVSSERLIVKLLSLKLNVHSVLLLVSDRRASESEAQCTQ